MPAGQGGFVIFLIGVAASVSEAATRTYIGPNNGNWSVAGHWQENAPRWMATTSTFRLVANYFGGSVAVLPILADGRLGDATDVKSRRRQDRPDQGDERPAGQLRRSAATTGPTPT